MRCTGRSYYTIRNLREDIAKVNKWLADDNFSVRFEEQGRNGYQAVDEYSVHPDGSRNGSGVNRNICCGSSRECMTALYYAYNILVAQARKAG